MIIRYSLFNIRVYNNKISMECSICFEKVTLMNIISIIDFISLAPYHNSNQSCNNVFVKILSSNDTIYHIDRQSLRNRSNLDWQWSFLLVSTERIHCFIVMLETLYAGNHIRSIRFRVEFS